MGLISKFTEKKIGGSQSRLHLLPPCTMARQRARARKDGLAVVTAVNGKRHRYHPFGGELIPMA